jgi:hypothetical protein
MDNYDFFLASSVLEAYLNELDNFDAFGYL